MPQDFRTLVEAAHRLPDKPHKNTVIRWATTGCNGVVLRTTRFGGKRLTTDQWINEFIEAVLRRNGRNGSEHLKAEAQLDSLLSKKKPAPKRVARKRRRAAV